MADVMSVLQILVKTQGASAAAAQLSALEGAGEKAGRAADSMAARHKKGVDAIVKASKVGTVAVAGLGAGAIKMAGDYESSMNTLQAVSGASAKQMKQLSDLAIKLGADVRLPGTSAKDASEAMTEMIKAGVSLKDTMAGTRGVLVLSAAAGVSNARAAEIASNALNAFKLKGKDVNMVVDQLANTANASSVEINDVADSFKMAAAVFAGFQGPAIGSKKAMTELNVAVGILGNAGIKGSDAGTSLKQTLLQLTGPSMKSKDAMKALYVAALDSGAAEGHLGDIIKGTTKERGKALNAMTKHNKALQGNADIAYDAKGRMRSLKEIIDLVAKGTKNMTQEEKNAYLTQIFGADATRSVIALMQAGPSAFDKMTASVTKQGAAQKLADAKMKGFKGSLEAAKSAIETMAISTGTVLLPAVTSIVHGLTDFVGILSKHQTITMVVIGVLGTLSATVWTVITAHKAWKSTMLALEVLHVKKIATTIADTAAMVAHKAVAIAVAAASKAWAAAQWLVNAALSANPITLVIVAIGALVAAIIVAYHESDTFRKIVDDAWALIKKVAGWLITAGVTAFTAVKNAVVDAWGWVKRATEETWNGVRNFLTGLWGALKTAVSTYFNGYKTVVTGVWGAISTVTTTIWGTIKSVATGAWNALHTAAATTWGAIKSAILTPIREARGLLGDIWDKIKGAASEAWDKLKTGAGGFATSLKDTIVDAFKGAVNLVVGFVNKIIDVINAIPGVPNIGHVKGLAQGGVHGGSDLPHGGAGAQAFARGGAFARTGGLVNSPITLMGEEAPRHPEIVIPTNPAYRSRAQALAQLALSKVGGQGMQGFKKGGIFGDLAEAVTNPAGALANLGLGIGSSVGDVLSKLPNPGEMLPKWLIGTGKWALGKVKDWIKGKLASVVGGPGGDWANVPADRRIAAMVAMANRMEMMRIPYGPQGHAGWALNSAGEDCSSTVSKVLHAAGYLSSVLTTVGLPGALAHGSGKYVTVHDRALPGAAGHTIIQLGSRFFGTSNSNPGGGPGWISASAGYLATLPTKLHPAGLAEGGMFGGLPFAGSFGGGGIVPGPIGKPYSAVVHGGEAIGDAMPEIHIYIGDKELTDIVDVRIVERNRKDGARYRAGVLAS